ncbi:MAG: cytochrome c [Zavarzinella sp.]|nr:cytochrome c [Zavarzinella sp.]
MKLRLRALAGLAGVLILVIGCNKPTETSPSGPPPGPRMGPGGPKASANASPEELFKQQCAKCHRGGQSGKGGPDLTKLTEDSSKNADWIAEHIKNPKGHNTESRMPKFEDRLTPEQIKKLAEYVLTLKS